MRHTQAYLFLVLLSLSLSSFALAASSSNSSLPSQVKGFITSKQQKNITPDEAIQKLIAGNKRYISGKGRNVDNRVICPGPGRPSDHRRGRCWSRTTRSCSCESSGGRQSDPSPATATCPARRFSSPTRECIARWDHATG